MVNEFKEPEPAVYFSNISDLLFDPNLEIHISYDHIFKDNCDRLPMDFLRHECEGVANLEAEALLKKINAENSAAKRKALYEQLGSLITDDRDLFAAMKERLIGAKDRTLKRVRRNYKLAVPCFFPSRNVMSMMLPLSFSSTAPAAVVLVCERTKSNEYLGQTILTLPMAYIDARLLCRPGSEWLDTRYIHPKEETELEED